MKPILLLVLLAGCAVAPAVRWNREDLRPVAVKGDRQLDQVKFWSRDSVFEWHWVTITRDSIRGYPDQPPGRAAPVYYRALPLSAVDSLLVGYRDANRDRDNHDGFGSDMAVIGLILLALLTP